MPQWIAYVRKALIAATAALGQVVIVMTPGSDAGSSITPAEWVTVAIAAAGTLGVYAAANGPRPTDGDHEA